jgi:DNA-binding MarR family transcriptional regulator
MTMGELGRQIVLSSGGVTRLMDRLAEQGLAERKACSTDRRIQYAAITDKGLEKLRGALKHHLEDLSREFTDRMSADELETIVRVMDRLRSPG